MDDKVTIKYSLLLPLVFMLLGCATTSSPLQLAKYQTNLAYQYPPISIFFDDISPELANECRHFNDSSALNHCRVNAFEPELFWQSFEKTNLFNQVNFAGSDDPYQVVIATATLDGETAQELSQSVLSGASLLLIPMENKQLVKAEVSIYWKNLKLRQYQYELAHVKKTSLFNDARQTDADFSDRLISHIIADAQQDELFSAKFLRHHLSASDYEKNLTLPPTIAGFELAQRLVHNDPLYGSLSTYASQAHHNDKIDIFVYPIRQVLLEDQDSVLAKEMQYLKREIRMFAEQLQWQELNFAKASKLVIDGDAKQIKGLSFEATYLQDFGEVNYSSTYLFMMQDKFIKVRATFPKRYLDEHISQAITAIKVPQESLFMAQLRASQRSKSLD